MKGHPLRTTVVGSYPFPGWLERASQELERFGPDDLAELQEDAVIAAVHGAVKPIETLFVPAQGSWMKLVEAIDFVRAIKPTHAHAIHDAGLSGRGLDSANAWFDLANETDYRWLAPGETA